MAPFMVAVLVLAFSLTEFFPAPAQILEKGKILLGSNPSGLTDPSGEEAAYVPEDPLLGKQISLKKSGFPKGWAVTRGKGVEVAVVDSGIAADHPDLSGKIAAQKDFLNDDRVAEDKTGHGTLLAGIIAATTNNSEGIAGGCSRCHLLIAKAFGLFGGNRSDIAEAIRWSADQGAEVINVSFSGPNTKNLKSAVDYAQDEGAVVVAAAPNRSTGTPSYPAAYDDVLAVVTTDRSNPESSTTMVTTGRSDQNVPPPKYGVWVDVAAPGDGVLSTTPGGGYKRSQGGTSLAAAQVSALAALLAAQGRSPEEIRSRIESTAVDLGAEGRDPYYGYGRIDAAQAVQ